MGQAPDRSQSALDRPAARIMALGVVLAVVASLGWLHWDDLFPPEPAALAADDPVQLCLAERLPGIAQMQADGVIDESQAALFTTRATALCEAQAKAGGSP